jgi:hypothetical protein
VYLIKNLENWIARFFVLVEILEIGKELEFPLILKQTKYGVNYVNKLGRMHFDHITFMDLIEFQNVKMGVIRGYYYDGKRDFAIRDEIQKIFEIRKRYKSEGNPLHEIYKLILNSIYGKTILRPIDTSTKLMGNDAATKHINRYYNQIEESESILGCEFQRITELKPINKHFNFCSLGVNILSMSKRIMKEVMCLAENNGIKIYYQDTDSCHLKRSDVPKLCDLYDTTYHRELIGSNLGQFHSDFVEIDKGYESYATQSLFVGKKIYIDKLTNDLGHTTVQYRMKGIKQDVVEIRAKELFGQTDDDAIWKLSEDLYRGIEIEFDLCSGSSPCFDMKHNFSVGTKDAFLRKVHCV